MSKICFLSDDFITKTGTWPQGFDRVQLVYSKGSLSSFLTQAVSNISVLKGQVYAEIWCHGAGVFTKNARGEWYAHGGYGLELTADHVTLANVRQFHVLAGKLWAIAVRGCAAARIDIGHAGTYGDGNMLCSRLAQVTQAYVQASTALQQYNASGFLPWQGTVLLYGPRGNVVKVEHVPMVSVERPEE